MIRSIDLRSFLPQEPRRNLAKLKRRRQRRRLAKTRSNDPYATGAGVL
jgi:hypothetical protein